MTAVAPLTFPGSRSLAAWWQQLTPIRPRSLWVAHLLLHRVEALVRLVHFSPLDRFTRLVLRALAGRPEPTLERLCEQFHQDRQLLRQVLRRLQEEGLAEAGPDDRWSATALCREVLDKDQVPHAVHERQSFHFLHSDRPELSPRFLSLSRPCTGPWPAGEGWAFRVSHLEEHTRRPAEWKQQHGFPPEVEQVVVQGDPEWRRVIVDHPEHLLAAVVLTSAEDGGDRLLGFAVQQEGWSLQTSHPVFTLGVDWKDTFPEFTEDPSLAQWRQALRAWGQPRNLPVNELDACPLQRQDHRLRVTVTKGLLDRLRAARSDALKGEAWLLAGEGRIRTAARLEVLEAGMVS